jgi:hypothetical protein
MGRNTVGSGWGWVKSRKGEEKKYEEGTWEELDEEVRKRTGRNDKE